MNQRTRRLTHAAIIGALYAAMCYLQNFILPGSGSGAIQMRVAEALCVLAFFTPAAVPGLALGCLIFNLAFSAALPLDFLVGPVATFLAAQGMWMLRKEPFLGLFFPAVANGALIGWELAVYIGGGFWVNAVYVAVGEAAVMLTAGVALYAAMKKRKLDQRLFGG